MDQQKLEERSLVKNKRMNQNRGQKKIVFSGPKENEARKASAFQKAHLERVQAVIFINTKARARTKKEKSRELPIHRQDFALLKNSVEERHGVFFGNKAIGIPIALTTLQRVRGTTQDVQLGWRPFPWILPTVRRTLFRILVAHDQLDQERQSEGSGNMRCIVYYDRIRSLQ